MARAQAKRMIDETEVVAEPAPAAPSTPAAALGEPLALAGWRWHETAHGVALTVQLAHSPEDFQHERFRKAVLVMNDRQLRSLARDLSRATAQRGLPLFARKPWPQRIARRLVALLRSL